MPLDPLTAVSLFGGAFNAIGNIFGGRKKEKAAQAALNNFKQPELSNKFADTSISTMGADILREDAAASSADMIEAARRSGGRFLSGAMLNADNTRMNAARAAATDIDRQYVQRERDIAMDEVRIEGIEEQRAREELAGIGARLNAGRQQKQMGFRDIVNTGFGAASMLGGLGGSNGGPLPYSFGMTGAMNTDVNEAINLGMPRDYFGLG